MLCNGFVIFQRDIFGYDLNDLSCRRQIGALDCHYRALIGIEQHHGAAELSAVEGHIFENLI